MSYTPTDWNVGDTITEALMDKIEQGIENAYAQEVMAYTEQNADVFVAADTELAVATATVDIPAGWASWSCMAWASMYMRDPGGGGGVTDHFLRIDGTDLNRVRTAARTGGFWGLSVVGARSGMVTTGVRSVELRVDTSTVSRGVGDIALVVRAYRTG